MAQQQALPMFAFSIADEVLTVTPQDTAVILDAAFSTGLGHDDYTPLLTRAFAKVLGNPLASSVSKPQFDAAMRELLPEVAGWSDDRKEQMSYFLSHAFYALDREGLESVPTDELLVTMSYLCGGSKTAKLAFAFSLFDAADKEAIEQAELARLLSALLTGLFAFCSPSNEALGEATTDNAVHQCAVRTALDIFSDLGVDDESPLSFDQFGAWYNQFGFETIQWLELLDLRKWPAAAAYIQEGVAGEPPRPPSPNKNFHSETPPPPPPPPSQLNWPPDWGPPPPFPPPPPAGVSSGLAGGSVENPAIINFDFPTPFAAQVSITERDVARLAQILNLTDMHKLNPGDASRIFLAASEEGVLDRFGFDRCLRALVPFEQLIAEAGLDAKEALQVVDELSSRFRCFFDAFERHAGHGAPADELAAGFALLCAGTKSEKLAHAWEIVASAGGGEPGPAAGGARGRLTRRGLWRFLRGFLQMLMAVSQAAVKGLGPGELSANADSGAVWTAALVFSESTMLRSEEHSISFDEFAEWYTVGGFKTASWFELLDLKKWVMAPPVAEAEEHADYESDDDSDFIPSSEDKDDDNVDDEDDEEEEEEDDYSDDDSEEEVEEDDAGEEEEEESEVEVKVDDLGNKVMFSFQLTDAGHCLYVTAADAASVTRVVALSSLNKLSCEDLADALGYYAVPGPSAKPGSKRPMGSPPRLVVSMEGYNQALRLLLPEVSELQNEQSVQFLTTALANVFFAFSGCTDLAPLDELVTGLSLFVAGSKSAKLQEGFATFDADGDDLLTFDELRRFLGSVLTVLFACARQTVRLHSNQSAALVDAAVQGLAVRIMGDQEEDASCSFEEFGAWYNSEGCEVAPWLELLDLGKWQPNTVTPAAAAAAAAADSQKGGLNPDAAAYRPNVKLSAQTRILNAQKQLNAQALKAKLYAQGQQGWGDLLEEDDGGEEEEEEEGGASAESDEEEESLDSDDYGYQGPNQNFPRHEEEEEKEVVGDEDGGNAEEEDVDDVYGTGEANARFSFALMDSTGEPSSFTLRLSKADVDSLRALVTKTGLAALPVQAVCGPLLDAARDGLLDKRSFDAVVRTLIPSERLGLDERTSFSVLLSAVFYNFEATSEATTPNGSGYDFSESANALELAMGMSLLCHGDKSSKLNYAWSVIDLDEDGLLNRAELLFFLRSFVRMLISLSFEAAALSIADCRRYATDMASWLASTVMGRYADPRTGLVSFDGFAKWYHDGFHQVTATLSSHPEQMLSRYL